MEGTLGGTDLGGASGELVLDDVVGLGFGLLVGAGLLVAEVGLLVLFSPDRDEARGAFECALGEPVGDTAGLTFCCDMSAGDVGTAEAGDATVAGETTVPGEIMVPGDVTVAGEVCVPAGPTSASSALALFACDLAVPARNASRAWVWAAASAVVTPTATKLTAVTADVTVPTTRRPRSRSLGFTEATNSE